MFFAEAIPLPLPVAMARQRLLGLPDLARTLDEATLRAFCVSLAQLGMTWPVDGSALDGTSRPMGAITLPPYQRGETTVVPLRWSPLGARPSELVVLDANIELGPNTADSHPAYGGPADGGPADSRLAAIGSYLLPADLRRPVDIAVLQAAVQRMGRSLIDELAVAVWAAARLA